MSVLERQCDCMSNCTVTHRSVLKYLLQRVHKLSKGCKAKTFPTKLGRRSERYEVKVLDKTREYESSAWCDASLKGVSMRTNQPCDHRQQQL